MTSWKSYGLKSTPLYSSPSPEADSIDILISVDIRKRGCFLVDLTFTFLVSSFS